MNSFEGKMNGYTILYVMNKASQSMTTNEGKQSTVIDADVFAKQST